MWVCDVCQATAARGAEMHPVMKHQLQVLHLSYNTTHYILILYITSRSSVKFYQLQFNRWFMSQFPFSYPVSNETKKCNFVVSVYLYGLLLVDCFLCEAKRCIILCAFFCLFGYSFLSRRSCDCHQTSTPYLSCNFHIAAPKTRPTRGHQSSNSVLRRGWRLHNVSWRTCYVWYWQFTSNVFVLCVMLWSVVITVISWQFPVQCNTMLQNVAKGASTKCLTVLSAYDLLGTEKNCDFGCFLNSD